MIVTHLNLSDFRNYETLDVELEHLVPVAVARGVEHVLAGAFDRLVVVEQRGRHGNSY